MAEKSERERFIRELEISEPTHYGGDANLEELLKSFSSINYQCYSSLVLPKDLVVDLAISYCTQYSGYAPGSEIDNSKSFHAKMPLIIYSTDQKSRNRTLIWANGVVSYWDPDTIHLFIDKDLLKVIEALNES